MQHWSWSSAELPVVSIAAVWYSESIPDSHLQTWLTSRSSSLSFVLLHVGNCSPYLSLWLGSSALEKFNFFNGGKSQSYIELKIPIMDTCLSESPSWSVVFPVVMPVSSAVCSKTIHIHLGNKRTSDMAWKAIGHLKYWKLFLGYQYIYRHHHPMTSLLYQVVLLTEMVPPQDNGPWSNQCSLHPKLCWEKSRKVFSLSLSSK